MRHFALMKLLTVSSFAVSPDTHSTTTTSPPRQQMEVVPARPTDLNKATTTTTVDNSRRAMLFSVCTSAAFVTKPVKALDMDAFVNSQLAADTKNCNPKQDPKCKPELTKDQAMCQYGQSGDARAEACKRVKAAGGSVPTPGSQGRSLGGAYAM